MEPPWGAWGWRVPFLIGAALAFVTLLARSTMRESPEFERLTARQLRSSRPLRRTFRHERPALYRSFAISALGSITYYVGVTYIPTYLTSSGGFAASDALWLATAASGAVVLVTPAAGLLADRLGRRPTLLALAGLALVLSPGMFALMGTGHQGQALAGAIVLALIAGAVSAVGASAAPEQFAVADRLTGLAVGTVATTIFGGLTPYASQALLDAGGPELVPGLLVTAVALAVLPALRRLPETAVRRGALKG
jgi:MHS family proline/betaine transporter-like MFS transporter